MLGLKLIHVSISKRGTWADKLSCMGEGIFLTNRLSVLTAGAPFTDMD